MSAPLFFANADAFVERIKEWVRAGDITNVVIDLGSITDVDITGSESFVTLREWLDEHQVQLGFSRVRRSAQDRLRYLGMLRPDDRLLLQRHRLR